MPFTCDFTGSYYNPDPWNNQPCAVEASVPEGCPIHFVTPGPIDPMQIRAYRVPPAGDPIDTPHAVTVLGTDNATFSVMDVWSCDCAPTTIGVAFDRVELVVPDAVAGERVWFWGAGYQNHDVSITAPGPCVTPEWPSGYSAALACDRCPDPQDYEDSNDDGPLDLEVGCSASGDGSPVLLLGLALLTLRRRRSR
jgi:MYXO-CTERM domain-containing protein